MTNIAWSAVSRETPSAARASGLAAPSAPAAAASAPIRL
jgi:hypothetical protein